MMWVLMTLNEHLLQRRKWFQCLQKECFQYQCLLINGMRKGRNTANIKFAIGPISKPFEIDLGSVCNEKKERKTPTITFTKKDWMIPLLSTKKNINHYHNHSFYRYTKCVPRDILQNFNKTFWKPNWTYKGKVTYFCIVYALTHIPTYPILGI